LAETTADELLELLELLVVAAMGLALALVRGCPDAMGLFKIPATAAMFSPCFLSVRPGFCPALCSACLLFGWERPSRLNSVASRAQATTEI
jgi:hypothetical protein